MRYLLAIILLLATSVPGQAKWHYRDASGGVYTASDTTPAAFSFTDQTDVAVSTTITSAAITVSGINAPSAITVTDGTYDINASGTFVSGADTVDNGNTIRARHTSSASNSTATNTVVTISGVSDTFTSTTAAAGGGTVLVGTSTLTANTELSVDSEWFCLTSDPAEWTQGIAATGSGMVNTEYARLKYSAGSSAKMAIFSNTGTLLAVSSPVTISSVSTLTDVEFTFAGTTSITSGTLYYVGVISNGITIYGHNNVGWEGTVITGGNYTTPASFSTGDVTGSGVIGRFKIWLTD